VQYYIFFDYILINNNCTQVVEEVIRVANVSAFLLRKVVNEVDYKGTGLSKPALSL
jgi:hypothetical protein